MKKPMTWIAIACTVLVLLGLGAYVGFVWMTGRAMFEPGTVVDRVRGAGGSLVPATRDTDRWRVAPDIELAHDSFGNGAEHVVFVHGGPGFPTRSRPRALELLAHSYTVHDYDQRGAGDSTRPFARAPSGSFYEQLVAIESKLGLAEQIADLESIRHLLGRDRLVLVGHSFGALVAALYAAEFPDHVRALVLVSPAPLHVMPSDADLFALVRARLSEADRAEYDDYMASYFDFSEAMSLDERALSDRYARFQSFYSAATRVRDSGADPGAGGFMVLATYASLGRRHDWRDAFAHITAPAIVLHGRSDLVPEAHVRDFAAAIPGADFALVDAAHFALDEAPGEVASAVDLAISR